MSITILSVDIPLDEVDADINHRINMLEELNRVRFDYNEFKDFHSIRTLEWDLINELQASYVTGESIEDNACIMGRLCQFAPLEPYDSFLIYNVIPVFLDLCTYRIKEELEELSILPEAKLFYDAVYRRDDYLVMTFTMER